ncbi:hypothetical protein ABPG74_019535 [Tetrahymena malaccensis]
MKKVIVRLIVTVSLPILAGVAIVLTIFYQQLWVALNNWEQGVTTWIDSTQKQILFNSALSQKILEQYSFNQLQLHMVVINNLLQKYQDSLIIDNPDSTFTICSYRYLIFNQCPQYVYDQLNQSLFYVDLYFVRSVFKFDLLTDQQKFFIKMNNKISFYARAAFLASQKEGLIQLIYLYNSDTTSILYGVPSSNYNYTSCDYEYCQGDNFIEPYDPRCRSWYQFAQQNKGFYFYEPYDDAVGQILLMTLSSQIDYQNQFYSVNSIDFVIGELIQLQNSTLSKNAYSILFHEFNQTVFYHPFQIFYEQISWPDLEYFNINQFCSESDQQMKQCMNQKQEFSDQLQASIKFIQTGNYSIDEQINLDQMYQKWERFGQKQISIVIPIESSLKGINSQKPYSYAILMASRVISDQTDQLMLYNLFDKNQIRIPLILEFLFISFVVLAFILNYGYFIIYQVQYPIELLILFLRRSYMQQLDYVKNQNDKITLSDHLKQKIDMFKNSKKTSKSINKINIKQLDDQANLFYRTYQTEVLLSFNTNKQQANSNFQELKTIEQQQCIQTIDNYNINNTTFKLNNEEIKQLQEMKESPFLQNISSNKLSQTNSILKKPFLLDQASYKSPQIQSFYRKENQSVLFKKAAFSLKIQQCVESNQRFKLNQTLDYVSQLENIQSKDNQQHKIKILQGLKPLFLEMKIIKKTFQDLEELINYQIDSLNQNSEDLFNTLLHFSRAKITFQRLQNQTGLSRCYFNIGIVYLLKQEYSLASEYFESAIIISLQILGVDYQSFFNQKTIFKFEKEAANQVTILCKRIVSKAYSNKLQAFQHIYSDHDEESNCNICCNYDGITEPPKYKQNLSYNQIEDRYQQIYFNLQKSLDSYLIAQKIIFTNNLDFSDLFKIFLYQEILEILIFFNHKKQINQYICKLNELFQKLEDTSQIKEIQQSKQKLLLGMIENKNQNKLKAIDYFIQSVEEGQYYSPSQRKKAIFYIKKQFQMFININQIDIKLNENTQNQYDLTIILQLDYQIESSTFETCLYNIRNQNCFKSSDRIQILVYNSELNLFMPYRNLDSESNWNLIFSSIKILNKTIIQEKYNQLNWLQALKQSFKYIFKNSQQNEVNMFFDIIRKNEQKITQKQNFNALKSQEINDFNQRKKVICIFSKQSDFDQQVIKLNLQKIQNQFKLKNINIYHIQEFYEAQNVEIEFSSSSLKYESFFDSTIFINKLKKLREGDHLREYHEFLAILNNS